MYAWHIVNPQQNLAAAVICAVTIVYKVINGIPAKPLDRGLSIKILLYF
jgi:hypothetical protein